MKIFTNILVFLALGLIVFNITLLDFSHPFQGDSMVASIGIGFHFAVLILLILECLKKWKKDERQSIIMFDVLIIGGVFPAYLALLS
jgi:hypothetical protein